ncbi:MAG TPA: RluA family pseudouridine synthase [Phycisphaerales bacterium]|nr:RluA family pseudouridine synthase [Phycisphaerales bacterium]
MAADHDIQGNSTPPALLILPGGRVDPDAVRLAIGAEDDADATEGEGEGLCRVTFRLSRDLDKRLDKYLTDRISFMSRNQLQRLIEVGGVTVNGRAPKASTRLRLNDVIEVAVPPPPPTDIQPEPIPLDVLFEDDHFIVVNKQPDLIVHPARSHHSGTLLNALVHHFQRSGAALSTVGKEKARPGVVHRLDRDTSGVMVVAKDDEAHWKLGRQFENRAVDKRYLALVHGLVEPDADSIEAPIGPHPSKAKGQREKMVVRHDEMGKPAHTVYRVRQRFRLVGEWAPGFSLVELELKTGRTHQIRVHMSHIGYPLAGDDMYSGRPIALGSIAPGAPGVFERQALHATRLAFHHPLTNQPVVFTAPLPPDLRGLIALLRAHAESLPMTAIPGAIVDLGTAIG